MNGAFACKYNNTSSLHLSIHMLRRSSMRSSSLAPIMTALPLANKSIISLGDSIFHERPGNNLRLKLQFDWLAV
uniref:Uncharacterized protein n=1 Tax=Romanomermis culicivorax TaxID=13658 RepID=A0A915KS03_ROMCU